MEVRKVRTEEKIFMDVERLSVLEEGALQRDHQSVMFQSHSSQQTLTFHKMFVRISQLEGDVAHMASDVETLHKRLDAASNPSTASALISSHSTISSIVVSSHSPSACPSRDNIS
jgi:hypothetical protein